jgi:hypothetical protein
MLILLILAMLLVDGPGPQLRELQQHALSILADVILHMKDDF